MMDIINKALKAGAELLFAVKRHEDEDIRARRMGICETCDEYDPDHDQCGVCGCYMTIKTGLATNRNPHAAGRIEITHCPIGKWGEVPDRIVDMMRDDGIDISGYDDKDIADIYRKADGKPLLNNQKI